MEGRPRFDQEQPAEDDDDSKESSKKKRKTGRSFSLSGFVERARVGEGDESERPTEGRSILSRYERIRNRKDARPLIGEVQPVKDDEGDRAEKLPNAHVDVEQNTSEDSAELPNIDTLTNDSVGDAISEASEVETDTPVDEYLAGELSNIDVPSNTEGLDEEERSRWTPVPILEADESTSPPESSEDPVFVEPETLPTDSGSEADPVDEVETTPEIDVPVDSEPPAPSLEVAPVTPEPESIEAILSRRIAERVEDDTTEEPEPASTENAAVVHNNFTKNETYVYNENRNTGLHLLNYALARRRDTRDRNAANKQFKKVENRMDELAKRQKEIEYEKSLLEKQHNRVQQTPELTTVFDRSKVLERKVVAEKTTPNSENNRILEAQRLETKVVSNVENGNAFEAARVMEHVAASPESRGIVSEKIFEQRHEIKDQTQAPAVSSIPFTSQQSQYAGQPLPLPAQQSYSTSDYSTKAQPPYQKPNPKSVGYKEAVVTGAWGAIVGTIVFILLYVLTR